MPLIAVCVEGKLLKKAIGLAMLLAGKTKQMAVDTHHGRRRILLVALAKVASALHEQSLVLRDDRLLDTVEVLAHFPLDQLAGFEWIDIEGLGRRVADSKRLVTLFVWRKKTKREPGVQLSKFMGHLESFAHALGKRQSLLDGLQRFKLAAKRRVFASWHSGATESFAYRRLDLARKRDVLDRWMGERQDQLGEAGRIHASYLLAKCLRKWREQGADRHVDARLRDRLQRFRSRHSRAAQSTGGLFAQWRRLAALSRVAWEKQKDAKYRAFSLWSKRLVNAVWMGRTALFHDKIRRFRPVFAFIKAKSQKYAQAQSYLASHARLKRCYEIFAKWRGAVKTRSIKRRYYDTWLRKAQFLLSASQHARKLFSVTRQLKCFGKWRRKARCRVQLDSSMAARATGLLGRRQRLTFRTWKLKALHLQRNSDLVASWRRLEDKREVFAAWRNRAVVSHNCHTFHLRGVYQLFMGQWRDALAAKRESRTRLWRAFAAWRQHSKALKAVQCFAGSRFARNMVQSGRAVRGNAILNRVSAIRSAAQSADLTATSWFFGHWRHRVSRTGKLLGLLAEHERGRKCKQLQAMRLVLRYHDLENRAPQNDLARAWSSFKLGVARCRQRKLILGLRLDEHFGAREFVLHFRHFKTWERAFQVRKMEEHLCEQNLVAASVHPPDSCC